MWHCRQIDGLKRWAGAVLGAALLVWSSAAGAASFDVHEGADLNILVVTDEILPRDDEAFLAAVDRATANDASALVVLASPGGALGAGMHMGLIISERGLPTFVPEGEVCASACALAWLAGAPRMMTERSEIGFHQPYDERDGKMIPSIEANAVVGHYIATIGMGPEIVSFAVSAPPDQMGWLDLPTASTIGLIVTEVASGEGPPRGIAGLDRRNPPTDESQLAFVEGYVPVPVMRALTPVEVATLEVTGLVDGTAGMAGVGLPMVDGWPQDGVGVEIASAEAEQLQADLLNEVYTGDDLIEAHVTSDDAYVPEDELMGVEETIDGVIAARGPHMANVERAAIAALDSYGRGGSDALRMGSAECWREMRASPTPLSLQYCHVFDLVGSSLVEPSSGSDLTAFAIELRLRSHRTLLEGMNVVDAGTASRWREDATLVISMMDEH